MTDDVNQKVYNNNHVANPAMPNFNRKAAPDRNPHRGSDQAGSRHGEAKIDQRFTAKEMFRKQRDGK